MGRAAAPPEARSQRASELDATQSPHVKSRSQENSSYPQRQAVEDGIAALHKGKINLPNSHCVLGLPDPTNSLEVPIEITPRLY